MSKKSALVEWSVEEDEAFWQQSQTEPTPAGGDGRAPTLAKTIGGERRLTMVVLVLSLFLAVGWAGYGEYQEAAEASKDQASKGQVQIAGEGRAKLPPTSSNPQTYSLQRVEGKLTLTAADGDLVGAQQTLESAHFTFYYRAVDAALVAETAPQLDRLVERLRRDFGLPKDRAKIVVKLSDAQGPARGTVSYAKEMLTVASPASLSLSWGTEATTYLYQSLIYPVTGILLMDFIDPYPASWKVTAVKWRPFFTSLRLWAFWQESTVSSDWREALLRSMYSNARAVSVDMPTVPVELQAVEAYKQYALAENDEMFCGSYPFATLPLSTSFAPLTCTDQWDASRGVLSVYPVLILRLDDLQLGASRHSDVPLVAQGYQVVSGETILEYVVATYGQERMLDLVAALGEYDNWAELLPAVFGVSASDFEAGWNRWLAERYGEESSPSLQESNAAAK
jgi:hypothetical protein